MARKSWNSFTASHPHAHCLVTFLAERLGPKRVFDKKGKLLPTPYSLVVAAISTKVQGEWTSMKIGRECVFKFADIGDVQILHAHFGTSSTQTGKNGCATVAKLSVSDADYGQLAKTIGYSL